MQEPSVAVTIFTPFSQDGQIDYDSLAESARYYQSAGMDGLFVNCQTSEALLLTPEERLESVKVLVKAAPTMTVFAGVNAGANLKDQAETLRSVQTAGADVAVIWTSLLPSAENLADQILELANLVPGNLGIYEAPDPVHRLLPDEDLHRISQSGRFVFFKDTSRDNAVFARRMHILSGTSLASYQTNWKCLPGSLEAGAAGFSGWLSACRPEAVAAYLSLRKENPEAAGHLHEALFDLQETMKEFRYPASGKYLLARRGVSIAATRRLASGGLETIESQWRVRLDEMDLRVDKVLADCSAVQPAN